MPSRANGYRPNKAQREECEYWRAELAKLDSSQWQKASRIMDQITQILGHSGGPGGGRIEPRACRFCGFYGHTAQWCKAKKAHEEEQTRRFLEAEEMRSAELAKIERVEYDPLKDGQARTFNEWRIPFILHESGIGPIVGAPGEKHVGKWTFNEQCEVVLRN